MSGEKTAPPSPHGPAVSPSAEPPATLRNGNPRRDLATLPCCGARTRQGLACRQPAMRNGRCRFHGGKSTGARTEAGAAARTAAHTTHGMYGDAGRRLADLVRVLRVSSRLMKKGIYPSATDPTFGHWIADRLADEAARRARDPEPPEPEPPEPEHPPAAVLHAVTPPRAAWLARPTPIWRAGSCARHQWPPPALAAMRAQGHPHAPGGRDPPLPQRNTT